MNWLAVCLFLRHGPHRAPNWNTLCWESSDRVCSWLTWWHISFSWGVKINQTFLYRRSLCLYWTAFSDLLRTRFPLQSLGPVGTFHMKSSKPVASINEIVGFPLNGISGVWNGSQCHCCWCAYFYSHLKPECFNVSLADKNWWSLMVIIMWWVHRGHVWEIMANKVLNVSECYWEGRTLDRMYFWTADCPLFLLVSEGILKAA